MKNEIKLTDRSTVLSQGRWIRVFLGSESYGGLALARRIVCVVCKVDLRRDREVLVDEGKGAQKPIFMCNDGLRCSGRLRKRQLRLSPMVHRGHKKLRLRFRIRSNKLVAQGVSQGWHFPS